ncbi:MAG: hypothetical protein ACLUB2_00860 [Butyricicoccus pullicaecorum]
MVSVKADESIDLDATVFYNGFTTASRDDLLTWTVKGDIGTIDKNGVFTGTKKGSGSIVVSYGSYSKSIPVTVGMGAPQDLTTIADLESSQPLTTSDGTALTLTKDADQVARGYGALAVSVNSSAELNVPQTAVTKTPTVSLWAKADGSVTLTGIFTTADGETVEAAFGPTASANWQFLSCKAPDGAQALTGLRITGSGSVYLDHIQVSETAPLSTGAPAISFTSAPTTALVGSSVTVPPRSRRRTVHIRYAAKTSRHTSTVT